MKRVLYVLHEYPQISETYIASEIRAVKQHFQVKVTALRPANLPYEECEPFEIVGEIVGPQDLEQWIRVVRKFQPHIIHCHYITSTPLAFHLAQAAGGIFTARAHSFDVLDGNLGKHRSVVSAINSELCRGVLAFPFTIPIIRKIGIEEHRLVPCWPVADIKRFRDRSENGSAVMNVGAALPKKNMPEFIRLASLCPDITFNLYGLGYRLDELVAMNAALGHPANIMPPIEPNKMLPEYKKHRWLVYTASQKLRTVGWPLSVAEAQAAGVGVIMQNIRPDLREYIGPGAFLFDTIDEARRIIERPFPEDMREASFVHAEKSNVDQHIHLLMDLWS